MAETIDPPKSSRRGRPRGRPVTRLKMLRTIPTRCPSSLHQYLKAIYPFTFHTLLEFHAHVISLFIQERPWDKGLDWRKPRSIQTLSDGVASLTGWRQINVQVSEELDQKISNLALETGQTKAAFLYTAFFWYAQYIMPPKKVPILQKGP